MTLYRYSSRVNLLLNDRTLIEYLHVFLWHLKKSVSDDGMITITRSYSYVSSRMRTKNSEERKKKKGWRHTYPIDALCAGKKEEKREKD